MNINKYIEQAYQFFTSLAKEVVKELKPDHKMMAEHHKEMSTANFEASRAIVDEVSKASESIVSAINEKPVVESVEISNLDELTQGIEGVIDTLKTELGKIDKEIVVKNDLSSLTALFKSGEDKKDLLKALKSIENKIKQPEIADYTVILDELVSVVERIEAKEIKEVDLSGVQEMLAQISVGVNSPLLPDETFTYDKRLRVELSDKQLAKIGGGTIISGGGNNQAVVDALATSEETLKALAGLVPAEYDTVEVNFTDATKSVISTVVYYKNGNAVTTIGASYPTDTQEVYTNT